MRDVRRGITIAVLVTAVLVPGAVAVSWLTGAASAVSASVADPRVIADPASPGWAGVPRGPDPAMLVLVGSGLLGLAFIVSTTTRT